jgi:hypothetical protein
MKEKIEQIILNYQNAITEYFEMEVPMEDDVGNMDNFMENMKKEILELFE